MNDEQKQPEMIEKEQYLRLAADFENYRKRMESERVEHAKFAGQSVITEMLGLADMVEAAIAHAPDSVRANTAWFGGLEKVAKRFADDMKKFGLHRIETVGKPFDPALMESAQMKPPDSPGQEGTVAGEVQAGYTLHERVIRPAKVIVYQ
jgi:molecular chaperone GrpE